MMFRWVTGICGPILPLVLLAAACSQAGAEEAATEQAHPGQTVTLADLEEAEIQMKIVREQVVRREGRQFPLTIDVDWKVVVGRDGTIEHTYAPTAHTPRGTRRGAPLSGSFILDQVRDVQGLGSGRAVWQFKDATLTFLRTFKDGAFRTKIAFARGAEGLTCTATETFAREKGTGSITLNSAIDGVPTTILSWKQASSSCRVTKR